MGPQDAQMERILQAALATPEGTQLMHYLTKTESVPIMKMADLGDGVNGQYTVPGFTDRRYKGPTVELDRFAAATKKDGGVGTLLHELTHAAESGITRQAMARRPDPQLRDAYSKMRFNLDAMHGDPNKYPSEAAAQKMAPQWSKERQDYRAGATELHAFGVGNSASPKGASTKGPSHLDSTMATEFMILLDLATRAADKKAK